MPVIHHLSSHLRFKIMLSLGLTTFFSASYFTLQHVSVFPARALPLGPLDEAVVFDPRWIWPYQSVYLLIAVVPWAADSREDLARYARGFVLASCAGFICFALFPVAAPRPAVLPPGGMFGWVVSYDGPTNAFPSLHVTLALYTLLVGARLTHERLNARLRGVLVAAGALWVAAIAYASVATRQHYAIDVLAGLLLAQLSHVWAWQRPKRRAPAGTGIASRPADGTRVTGALKESRNV